MRWIEGVPEDEASRLVPPAPEFAERQAGRGRCHDGTLAEYGLDEPVEPVLHVAAGKSVALYDPDPTPEERARETVERAWPVLRTLGLTARPHPSDGLTVCDDPRGEEQRGPAPADHAAAERGDTGGSHHTDRRWTFVQCGRRLTPLASFARLFEY
jgi:hypothetical protein